MRTLVSLFLCLSLILVARQSSAFGIGDVDELAAAAARSPYVPTPAVVSEATDYDSHRQLRFVRDNALWHGTGSPFEVQFFAAGWGFTRPVQMFEVHGDRVEPIRVPPSAFTGLDGRRQTGDGEVPVVGARVTFPMKNKAPIDEVIAFLGASYFRAIGRDNQYGLSARGIAIDTVDGPNGEEFPAFTRFWFVRPAAGATTLTLYALLDGPSVTGAYRFDVRPGAQTLVDVQARWHVRRPVATFGIAPLTSMYLGGENQPLGSGFRPEIHDSDGLQLLVDGESIWRPLNRPAAPFATSFATTHLQGFGLMQRDNDFTSYQDLEAHYDRRPSAWVEPVGDWGAGRVVLLQLPTKDESEDNIVAFWQPAQAPQPGEVLALSWRIRWSADAAPRPELARVVQSRAGFGFRKTAAPVGQYQFHLDFVGDTIARLTADDALRADVGGANVRDLKARVQRNPHTNGWRLTLEFERVDARQAVELRAALHDGTRRLSETWSYALAPE